MSWEWRIFFENGPDARSILRRPSPDDPPPPPPTVERRTDSYKLIDHARFGLKVRGGGSTKHHREHHSLELKIRIDANTDGWERWIKRYIDAERFSEPKKEQLVSILKEYDDGSSLHRHVLDFMKDKQKLDSIQVHKSRVQVLCHDAVLEQTDLKIYRGDAFLGDYRTICIEGNRESILRKQVLDEMGAELMERSIVCGYPEFLERLVSRRKDS